MMYLLFGFSVGVFCGLMFLRHWYYKYIEEIGISARLRNDLADMKKKASELDCNLRQVVLLPNSFKAQNIVHDINFRGEMEKAMWAGNKSKYMERNHKEFLKHRDWVARLSESQIVFINGYGFDSGQRQRNGDNHLSFKQYVETKYDD